MTKYYNSASIENLEKIYRANLLNSLSGYKPANLIGTKSADGKPNLAIFSSVVHLGASPPLLGLIIRPASVPRHTYENMKETGYFTINHVHEKFVAQAHYTSAKLDRNVSEFDACHLTEEYNNDFLAPFVKESKIKLGLQLVDEIPIKLNNTILMIGKIVQIYLPSYLVSENGNVALDDVNDVAIAGLESYYKVSKLASFSYAKADSLPNFEKH